MTTSPEWPLVDGQTTRRTNLHARFGGNRQRGIVTTANNILLFSGDGEGHGYDDFAESDDFYVYTGEGKRGDQKMTRGNAAILKHADSGRPLRLFAGARGVVTYLGEYEYFEHFWADARDSSGIGRRRVVRFRLHKVDTAMVNKARPL